MTITNVKKVFGPSENGLAGIGGWVQKSTNQAIVTNTLTNVTFTVTVKDADNFHDVTAGANHYITIPPALDGNYIVGHHGWWSPNIGTHFPVEWYLVSGGGYATPLTYVITHQHTWYDDPMCVTGFFPDMDAGETVIAQVKHQYGANLNYGSPTANLWWMKV